MGRGEFEAFWPTITLGCLKVGELSMFPNFRGASRMGKRGLAKTCGPGKANKLGGPFFSAHPFWVVLKAKTMDTACLVFVIALFFVLFFLLGDVPHLETSSNTPNLCAWVSSRDESRATLFQTPKRVPFDKTCGAHQNPRQFLTSSGPAPGERMPIAMTHCGSRPTVAEHGTL